MIAVCLGFHGLVIPFWNLEFTYICNNDKKKIKKFKTIQLKLSSATSHQVCSGVLLSNVDLSDLIVTRKIEIFPVNSVYK